MAKRETDKAPVATPATTATRAEIEAALFETASHIVSAYADKEVIPGWIFLFKGDVSFWTVGKVKIPVLPEKRVLELVNLAEANPHAFDAASYMAGMHFAVGVSAPTTACPEPLRLFGAKVLMGEIKRPSQPGRPRVKDVPLRLGQYLLCRFTAERAPLPLSRSRAPSGPATFSACDAVAKAFTRAGRYTTQAQLASLCYDDNFAGIRDLAEALNMLDFDPNE